MQPAAGLYICYWSLMDPLCQTQSLSYLLELTAKGARFVLITFEQARFQLSPREAAAKRAELARQGIDWYPLKYHKRNPLIATGFDCVSGVLLGAYAAWRHRPTVVHSRGSIPAAMALGIKKLCGLKFLYDADSRLSLEYVENGHWRRDGLPYKITSTVESWARQNADAVVVLAERLRDDFVDQFDVRVPIEVIPCCVDTSKFEFDARARNQRRSELGWLDKKVLVYVGKIGARYLTPEIFAFLKVAQEVDPDVRLLVLSGDPAESFDAVANAQGVSRKSYFVTHSKRADVPAWLSAADAGIAFIRTAECERGSSPIKVGEYLAMGLPVVCTSHIGDVEKFLTNDSGRGGPAVGVILDDCTVRSYRTAVTRLFELMSDPELRARCRTAAKQYLDLRTIGAPRYRSIYDGLSGSERAQGSSTEREDVSSARS